MQLLRSLILLLVGAGALWYYLWSRPPGPGPVVDPRLESALSAWQSDMKEADLEIGWRFGRLERIFIDQSKIRAGHSDPGNRTVSVSNEVLKLGQWTTRAILYHELGHFIFGLNHTDEIGIMYKETLPEEVYRDRWPELYQDYLTQCKRHAGELKFR